MRWKAGGLVAEVRPGRGSGNWLPLGKNCAALGGWKRAGWGMGDGGGGRLITTFVREKLRVNRCLIKNGL